MKVNFLLIIFCLIFFVSAQAQQPDKQVEQPQSSNEQPSQVKIEKILPANNGLRKILCRKVMRNDSFETYQDAYGNQLTISPFEKAIYFGELKLKKEEAFANLSHDALRIQFLKLETVLINNDFWNMTCSETEAHDAIYGEQGLIQYMALNLQYELFFRLFFSGAYNLDILTTPVNDKKQTFFEWLEDSIINGKELYSDIATESLNNFRNMMLQQYPALQDKSIIPNKGKK